MITWILVIFIHAGAFSKNDDATMFSVPGFQSESDCRGAGTRLNPLVNGTMQTLTFVCIPQAQAVKK